jgi:hypothetical protein
MSTHPRDKRRTEPKDGKLGNTTSHGGLYDRNGPIPVPDVKESDTDSAWALFEESRMLQDKPPKSVQTNFEETQTDEAGFEPTDFGGNGYDETKAAPLKP